MLAVGKETPFSHQWKTLVPTLKETVVFVSFLTFSYKKQHSLFQLVKLQHTRQ